MALYKFDAGELRRVERRTMTDLKIRERGDLQPLLMHQIDVVSPGTLVISEEFSGWIGSLRRIDLLGIDPDGTLVVFELKRTEDGGHMDLQGIRYAAMASLLSFKEVVGVYAAHLAKHQPGEEAESLLREHLEPGSDAEVAAKVRIVLVSGDFGPEITTTVLWLRACSLDIRCVRLVPYEDGGSIYLDAQQIIPIPEVADYLLKLREKEERNEVARQGERDFTRFIVCHSGGRTVPLPKRRAMLEIIRTLVSQGHSPDELQQVFQMNRFLVAEGMLQSEEEFAGKRVLTVRDDLPVAFNSRRYFTSEDQLIHFGGKTYVFSNQWGSKTRDAMKRIFDRYPQSGITVEEVS
ncbi:hypothetical protein [Luteolibacter sp. Populi]|uniref:hypothetical protein n=1 Tax=Luteolibacter sp. Populi TaxID=3230487 RepID=UPI0034668149